MTTNFDRSKESSHKPELPQGGMTALQMAAYTGLDGFHSNGQVQQSDCISLPSLIINADSCVTPVSNGVDTVVSVANKGADDVVKAIQDFGISDPLANANAILRDFLRNGGGLEELAKRLGHAAGDTIKELLKKDDNGNRRTIEELLKRLGHGKGGTIEELLKRLGHDDKGQKIVPGIPEDVMKRIIKALEEHKPKIEFDPSAPLPDEVMKSIAKALQEHKAFEFDPSAPPIPDDVLRELSRAVEAAQKERKFEFDPSAAPIPPDVLKKIAEELQRHHAPGFPPPEFEYLDQNIQPTDRATA